MFHVRVFKERESFPVAELQIRNAQFFASDDALVVPMSQDDLDELELQVARAQAQIYE